MRDAVTRYGQREVYYAARLMREPQIAAAAYATTWRYARVCC